MKLSKVLAITLLGAVAMTNTAMASGTTAGTKISNTPTLTYSMGGANKSLKAPVSSYVVDKVINFTVTLKKAQKQNVIVSQNALGSFVLTNTGNSVENFVLTGNYGSLKQFTFTGHKIYVDANNNGILDNAERKHTPVLAKLGVDSKKIIWIDATTSSKTALSKGNHFGLLARATANGVKEIYKKQTAVNSMSKVDIVFADGASGGDKVRDNQVIMRYIWTTIENASNVKLNIVKEYEKVVKDPVNGTKNPKAIPGAQVLLKYQITNKTKTEAKNVTFTVKYDASKVRLASTKEIVEYGVKKPYFITDSRGRETGKAVESKKGTITFTIPSIKAGVTYYPHTSTIIK